MSLKFKFFNLLTEAVQNAVNEHDVRGNISTTHGVTLPIASNLNPDNTKIKLYYILLITPTNMWPLYGRFYNTCQTKMKSSDVRRCALQFLLVDIIYGPPCKTHQNSTHPLCAWCMVHFISEISEVQWPWHLTFWVKTKQPITLALENLQCVYTKLNVLAIFRYIALDYIIVINVFNEKKLQSLYKS